MDEVVRLVPQILLALAVLASGYKIKESVLGVRATTRLHFALQELATNDRKLQEIISGAASRPLTDEEMAFAIAEVKAALGRLSQRDRHLVVQGIEQASAAGAKRYIREVLTAA